ncbi:MAG: hypothetical protein K6D37_07580 [Prevotella sp.]|nr:hypothetical protein [Prevotella sp.]
MKKSIFLAMLSAIVLTGTMIFTACSSSEDAVEPNPTYDGTAVRTDFAFNISKAAQTRMSGTNVQESQNFRGMSHMYLFPFDGIPADGKETNITNNYALGTLENAEISTTKSKKIYSLVLPIGTDNFLFYGTATRGTNSYLEVGRLSSSFYDKDGNKKSSADDIKNTNGISFSLEGIASSLGDHSKIAAYLTAIANTTDWAGTVDIVTNHTLENSGAYKALADLYTKFTTTVSDRCGSGEAVERTILDLYKSASLINNQSSVPGVTEIARAIIDNINTAVDGVKVIVAPSNETPDDPEKWTATLDPVDYRTFPANLGLPLGAAQLTFNSTNGFSYKGTVAAGATLSGVSYMDICYPAEIVYFDNSPLRATNVYKTENDYPSTPKTWDYFDQTSADAGFTTDWKDTEVKADTRAVAMQNNVNYGVALLQTNVKLAQQALTDNMAQVLGGAATNQTDIDGTGMKVTGLIIGGQPATVGWDMISHADNFTKVIYDNDLTFKNTALSTSVTDFNYTVVLDNYKSTQHDDVYFALQITNGEKDFYGKSGMIPAGHTFYLVGKMTLTSEVPQTFDWAKCSYDSNKYRKDTGYRITGEGTKRIFIQDYMTRAYITIKADALQNAYSTIPDLRSTETVFGLSVDLKWEPGLRFNVEI